MSEVRVPQTFDEAVRLAEAFAKDAVKFAKAQGWAARYERHGNSFIVFTDGIATNEIEIAWVN